MTARPLTVTRSTGATEQAPAGELIVASVPASHVYVRHIAPEVPGAVRRLPDPDPGVPRPVGRADVVAAGDAASRLDPDARPGHVPPAVRLRRLGARGTGGRPGRLAQQGRPGRLHRARPPEPAPRGPHAARPPARRAGPGRRCRGHPHARGGRRDPATVGTGGDGAAAPARRRLRHHATPRRATGGPGSSGSGCTSRACAGAWIRCGSCPRWCAPSVVSPGACSRSTGTGTCSSPAARSYDEALAEALRQAVSGGRVEVHVHDFLSDAALWEYLAALDVSVLPYRFGTHSGWLEACRDLGTTVVAPSCGYFADQAPVLTYVHDESSYDERSLEDGAGPGPVPAGARRDDRRRAAGPARPGRRGARDVSTGRCSRDARRCASASSRRRGSRSENPLPAASRRTPTCWPPSWCAGGTRSRCSPDRARTPRSRSASCGRTLRIERGGPCRRRPRLPTSGCASTTPTSA